MNFWNVEINVPKTNPKLSYPHGLHCRQEFVGVGFAVGYFKYTLRALPPSLVAHLENGMTKVAKWSGK